MQDTKPIYFDMVWALSCAFLASVLFLVMLCWKGLCYRRVVKSQDD